MQYDAALPALDLPRGTVIPGLDNYLIDLPLEAVHGSRVYAAVNLKHYFRVVLKVVAWTEAERTSELEGLSLSSDLEQGDLLPSHAMERRLLRSMRHENIVQLLDSFFHYDCEGAMWLVMVFKPHGIVYNEVKTTDNWTIIVPESWDLGKLCASPLWREGYMGEDSTRTIFRQIVRAVKYLLSYSVIHRDLILENMLVDEKLTIKLVNFASAIMKDPNTRCRLKTGTKDYWPPEMRGHGYPGFSETISVRSYTLAAAEVYAMGCLLLELVQPQGYRMYDLEYDPGNPDQLSISALKILDATGTPNERWSSEGWAHCRELILNCRHDNWRRRPSISELMGNEWLFPADEVVPANL